MTGMQINSDVKLLLKPRPYVSESLAGYQLRLAEVNGYSSGVWLSRYFLGTSRITIRASEHITRVALILGLQPEEMDRLAYAYDDVQPSGYIRYFGQKLHLRHVKIKSPALCPHCLREMAVTNGFWDLKFAVACPFHSCRLVDSCQQCGECISWNRSKICECPKCKFDYRDSLTEIASPDVMEIVRLLYSIANTSLLTVHSHDSCFAMPIAALKSESLITLIWMLSFISRSINMEAENSSDKALNCNLSRLSREYHEVCKAAYFLNDWPTRLIDGLYVTIAGIDSQARYAATKVLLVAITRPNMPLLFQKLGQVFIESATFVHNRSFLVDQQTLELVKLKVSACF